MIDVLSVTKTCKISVRF